MSVPMRRRAWAVRAAYLAAIALALGATVFIHRAPVLAIWLATACTLGAVIALAPGAANIPGQRILTLLEAYAAIVLFSLLGIFILARSRTEAVQVEYRGVKVSNTDQVKVGVGDDSLDISLEGTARSTAPWSVRLEKIDSGWTARSNHSPEELMMSHQPPNVVVRWLARTLSVTFWQPVSGTVVRPGSPATRIVVPAALHRAESPDTVAFRLVRTDSSVIATLGRQSWVVSASGDSLSYRSQEGLRRGRYLSELQPVGVIEGQPVADLVRIRRLRASERVGDAPTLRSLVSAIGERMFGSASAETRYLVSAESPVEIAQARASVIRSAGSLGASEIVARSGEEVWRFTWRPDANGVVVEFLRRPKKRLLPLMATSSCPVGSACNIVSLKRVPPPSPQFLLSEGGLDSARFELFGRLTFDENTVWFVGDASRVAVSSEEGGTAITAKRIGAPVSKKSPQAAVILIARRGSLSASWDVLKVAVGVFCILMCLFGMIKAVLAQRVGLTRSIDERPLALAINGLLALGLARLILGTRVTTFPPFAMRGVATAIGLWVSIAVAMVLILWWRSWYGYLSEWCRHGTSHLRERLTHAVRAGRRSVITDAGASRWPLIALVAGLILLGLTSFDAVLNGAMMGVVVALAWAGLSVAVTAVAPAASSVAMRCLQGPWGVLEANLPLDISSPAGRRLSLGLALVLATCSLAAVAPSAYLVAMVVALPLGVALRTRHRAIGVAARSATLVGLPIAVLATQSDSRSAAALALALSVGLFVVRGATSLRQGEVRSAGTSSARLLVLDLFGALLPIVLLAPLLLTDVGLFLIVVVPIVLAGYVASNVFRSTTSRRVLAALVIALIGATLAWRLKGLPTQALMNAPASEVDARVRNLQQFFGVEHVRSLRRSLANVASRGLAASSQAAAERALALGGPGETREYLLRAIEQTWGTRAYAAGGLTGTGLGDSPVGGRGIAEAVAYAENSFAVFVLSENGALGGLALLLCYFIVVMGTMVLLTHRNDLLIGERNHAMRALLVLSLGLLVLPACYVGLSNVGALPITGQNMPFIGLNAWSDVLFCTGIVSFFLVAALRLNAEALGTVMEEKDSPTEERVAA